MRNSIEIEIWMKRKELTVGKIQSELGYANHGTVSNTIAGRKHYRKVLRYLRDAGCPAEYLDLPKNMREAA